MIADEMREKAKSLEDKSNKQYEEAGEMKSIRICSELREQTSAMHHVEL